MLGSACGEIGDLTCSHDGKFVFDVAGGPPQEIVRIPVSGDTADEVAQLLAEDVVTRLSLSRDRKALRYACEKFRQLKVKLAIVLMGSGHSAVDLGCARKILNRVCCLGLQPVKT